jgi:hypothetical protein
MKMHRITPAAISEAVKPNGENQESSGDTACGPAAPLKARPSAMTLSKISTANWNVTKTAWIRSLITMPRYDT